MYQPPVAAADWLHFAGQLLFVAWPFAATTAPAAGSGRLPSLQPRSPESAAVSVAVVSLATDLAVLLVFHPTAPILWVSLLGQSVFVSSAVIENLVIPTGLFLLYQGAVPTLMGYCCHYFHCLCCLTLHPQIRLLLPRLSSASVVNVAAAAGVSVVFELHSESYIIAIV